MYQRVPVMGRVLYVQRQCIPGIYLPPVYAYSYRYLVYTGIHVPGITNNVPSVRKCKDHLYVHILIKISFTFPDEILTITLLDTVGGPI